MLAQVSVAIRYFPVSRLYFTGPAHKNRTEAEEEHIIAVLLHQASIKKTKSGFTCSFCKKVKSAQDCTAVTEVSSSSWCRYLSIEGAEFFFFVLLGINIMDMCVQLWADVFYVCLRAWKEDLHKMKTFQSTSSLNFILYIVKSSIFASRKQI